MEDGSVSQNIYGEDSNKSPPNKKLTENNSSFNNNSEFFTILDFNI